eukprot:4730689-Pleurochrysis_carterae.AAC.3
MNERAILRGAAAMDREGRREMQCRRGVGGIVARIYRCKQGKRKVRKENETEDVQRTSGTRGMESGRRGGGFHSTGTHARVKVRITRTRVERAMSGNSGRHAQTSSNLHRDQVHPFERVGGAVVRLVAEAQGKQ